MRIKTSAAAAIAAAALVLPMMTAAPAEAAGVVTRSTAATQLARQVKVTHGPGITARSCASTYARTTARQSAKTGRTTGSATLVARVRSKCRLSAPRVVTWKISAKNSTRAIATAKKKIRASKLVKTSRYNRFGVGVASKGKKWRVVIVLATARTTSPTPPSPPSNPPATSDLDLVAAKVLNALNGERRSARLKVLPASTCLAKNATNWARQLVPVIDSRAKLGLDRTTDHRADADNEAATAACYPPIVRDYGTFYGSLGDIIVLVPKALPDTAGEALTAWMNSPGHRAWVLKEHADEVWVQVAYSSKHDAYVIVADIGRQPIDPGPPPA